MKELRIPSSLTTLGCNSIKEYILDKIGDPYDLREALETHGSTRNAHLCVVLETVQNQIWVSRRKPYDLSSSTAPESRGVQQKAG
jgi:hypothetical protein